MPNILYKLSRTKFNCNMRLIVAIGSATFPVPVVPDPEPAGEESAD